MAPKPLTARGRTPPRSSSSRAPTASHARGYLALGCLALGCLPLTTACSGGTRARSAVTTTAPTSPSTPGSGGAATTAPLRASGVEQLAQGDCYLPPPDPSQENVIALLVACSTPHRSEVYDAFRYEGPDAGRNGRYPGLSSLRNWAEERCYERFFDFVKLNWEESELDIEVWYPTPESWYNERDRKVTCTVHQRDGELLTGSMAGSKR